MKVLQLNVRLQEGGAARIALDLHRQLLGIGIESRFGYGWGEKGGISSAESYVTNSFQVGHRAQVAANMLLHQVTGIDCVPPVGLSRQRFLDAIRWADVIHLHAIHSYFLPFSWLLEVLVSSGKPVVWTAHDYWMLTGRCASTDGCDGWKHGCGTCPTLKNYPKAYFDFSSMHFTEKRRHIAKLGSLLHIVTPSLFLGALIREGFPNIKNCVISNWIDSEFESVLNNIQLSDKQLNFNKEIIRVVVVSNDLSDSTKVDQALINQLLLIPHIEIHTIGHNSPFIDGRVVNHGRIADRRLMVEAITRSDVALFTSDKDTFGLVMIEALACGTPVLAVESSADSEVMGRLGIRPIVSKPELVNLLKEASLPICYFGLSRQLLRQKVLQIFGGNTAILKYSALYSAAVS